MSIWLCSDWHFGHDREFIWRARGFNNIDEMNEAIIARHNSVVARTDEVYVLGDLTLGYIEAGKKLINQMNGNLHIILGNHDTENRIEVYNTLHNVADICYSDKIRYSQYNIFLSHYPCITGSLEHDKLRKTTLNFFGHTHRKDKFYQGMPFMYNVAMDAHDCRPVLIDDALRDMEREVEKCKKFL